MELRTVGTGPALDAVEAALADAGVETERGGPDSVEDATVAVVSDVVGESTFSRVNDAAIRGETAWIAVELGGLGGKSGTVEASVAGFGPEYGCYECLQTRVTATGVPDDGDPGVERRTARLAGAVAGHRLVGLLAGDDAIRGRVLELPWIERELLPVPGCPACGDTRDRSLPLNYEGVTLDDALARAERGLDERLGPVVTVGEADSFPAPYYLSTLADTAGFSDATAATQAAGVDVDWNAAFMKALGEALERYAAGVYRTDEFVTATADELDAPVAPDTVVAPGEVPARDEPIPWVRGVSLVDGTAVHLPAELVHFPPPERRIRPAITTGLGLGCSTIDAVRSGLTEVLERDASMLAWYSTYEPVGLTVDDDGYRELVRRARAEELSVSTVLLTGDVDIPVIAAVVERDEWPRLALGSAAALDPVAAARSALAEALQNWMELRALGPDAAADEGAFGRYAAEPGPVSVLFDIDAAVPAATVGPAESPTGADALEALVERVRAAGLEAYAARLTTRDLDRIGLESVRVVVPAAQPLFVREPYFGERAREVPAELGFEPRLDRELHPFP